MWDDNNTGSVPRYEIRNAMRQRRVGNSVEGYEQWCGTPLQTTQGALLILQFNAATSLLVSSPTERSEGVITTCFAKQGRKREGIKCSF